MSGITTSDLRQGCDSGKHKVISVNKLFCACELVAVEHLAESLTVWVEMIHLVVNEGDNESMRSPLVSIYAIRLFIPPSTAAVCYLCCHLHRWTRLPGTYPMISSISGPINTISNVLSLHMTVCLKTSLSPSLRPRRQCVGANGLCCLCGIELREWLSGGGFWNRDRCIVHCFLYLLHQLNDVCLHSLWAGLMRYGEVARCCY